MKGVLFIKKYKVYICFAFLAILMVVLYPNEGHFKYDYQRGRPWLHETLLAPIDFPILKTETELLKEKEEKASKVIDYYAYNSYLAKDRIESFNKSSEVTTYLSDNGNNKLIRAFSDNMTEVYNKGIVSSFDDDDLSDKVIFVQKEKRALITPALEVFDVDRAYNTIISAVRNQFPDLKVDSLGAILNVKTHIVPNLLYDKNTSQLLNKEAVNYISPTKGMIYTGQLIVSKGEIITADIEQMLDSFKAEYKLSFGYSGSKFWLEVSHITIVLIIIMLIFLTIYFVDNKLFADFRKLVFILILVFLSYAATVLLNGIDSQILFLLPYAVFILFSMSFFKPSFVFPTYIISLIPILFISNDGIEIFALNAVAGAIALVSFSYFNRGWLQFVNSVFIYVGMLIVYISFEFSTEGSDIIWQSTEFIYLAINSLLVVVLYPFVFLFEKIFSLVSNSKLWYMTDTNNKLLQELAHKAPGTFQHSIQVANLAENAAREIEANSMLVRVGALYHDIGKIENPQCFVENQAPGIDYHKGLSPAESAQDIIKHVDDGVALAKKYGLPDIVIDFIKSHHGHSQTLYFYNKYCNEGGNPENKAPFTYEGILPISKEQVIVMMADAVEAASRSLKSYTQESISALVEKILESRLSDDQLVQAEISIREINIVKESFKNYLLQIYHARIIYPKRKKIK
ncbi:MAG: HDIG domain-containing metalloprotein [Bacteroidales bacterium]|jgi:hypothetical protein